MALTEDAGEPASVSASPCSMMGRGKIAAVHGAALTENAFGGGFERHRI